VETRTPTQVDAETLATLASEVFAEAYASAFPSEQALLSHVQAVFTPTAIEEDLKVSSVWYSLGLTQGMPAGFIKMEKSKPLLPLGDDATTVELSKLYVLSRFHGSGMADRLMAEGLGYAHAQNLSTVWLCVWERNPRAQAFYRRWGFSTVGEVTIPLSGVPFRDLVMRRVLKD
jgi:diamine N-acetyltransferase